jgi:hypothetical protein
MIAHEYFVDSPDGGEFSIDTSGDTAVLRVGLHPETVSTFAFDRATARELGTSLLRWTGGPTTCTLDPVAFGELRVEVTDGEAMFLITGPAVEPWGTGRTAEFPLSDDDVVDLSQRLIVWAGVNV